jgi:translation elongation factor EF-Tu-like GTPase
MNRFAIEDSFAIEPDRFVFAGRVIEGRAERGMVFEVPEAGHRWQVTVRAVEFIRKRGGDELTGLVVQDADYLPGLGSGWTAELYEADAS